MFNFTADSDEKELIEKTKSGSGISGPELCRAHAALGTLLARQLPPFPADDTAVVAVLRGGVFFAQGIYFELGCKFEMWNPKDSNDATLENIDSKNIIVADSVINTGSTVNAAIGKLKNKNIIVTCCVASEAAARLLGDSLYAVRVSQNSYVGANVKKQENGRGPDTTMRLFNQL